MIVFARCALCSFWLLFGLSRYQRRRLKKKKDNDNENFARVCQLAIKSRRSIQLLIFVYTCYLFDRLSGVFGCTFNGCMCVCVVYGVHVSLFAVSAEKSKNAIFG